MNPIPALFELHTFSDFKKINSIMEKYRVKDNKEYPQLFEFNKKGFYYICRERVKNVVKGNVKAGIDWFKTTLFSIFLFLFCQYQMIFGINVFFKILCSLISGISLTFLGYNLLHDGSHCAISKNPKINILCSKILQCLQLWNHTLWTYHHCIRHHQYTGMINYDPDLINSNPFLRKSKLLKPKWLEFTKKNLKYKFLFLHIFS